jgi:hypothetical protein
LRRSSKTLNFESVWGLLLANWSKPTSRGSIIEGGSASCIAAGWVSCGTIRVLATLAARMAHTRIVISWTRSSGYLNTCLCGLATGPHMNLLVIHQTAGEDAPFDESQFSRCAS